MKGKISGKAGMVAVLKKSRRPLPTKEIVTRTLALPDVKLGGKTPAATLAAILATENAKTDGLFERTAPGTYRLRKGRS
jgi:HB1/ASXL restriction endonuclease-like protein with HTH domain